MNPYEPPRSLVDTGIRVHGPLATIGLSVFVGMISYYISHSLFGILSEWKWPKFLDMAARLYEPITSPAVDLLMFVVPIALAYAAIAYAWSWVIGSRALSTLAAFCLGWLVPALFVVSVGERMQPGV